MRRASTSFSAGVSTSQCSRVPFTSGACTPGSPSRLTGAASSALTVVRVRWRISASVPVSAVRPARMIVTRSDSASASARMWLDSSTVRPRCRSSSTHSRKAASISGSSPAVGSSKTSSSASLARAAISATFCRLPLE